MITGDLDTGDRDPGDYDPGEISRQALNVWHPSYLPAELGRVALPAGSSQAGRAGLKQALSLCTRRRAAQLNARPATLTTCWHDTPEPFRKLVARSAGLALDVVDKLDRDLSETEKAMIRNAAKRLKERADALFAL